jgi:hypothetical protein
MLTPLNFGSTVNVIIILEMLIWLENPVVLEAEVQALISEKV